MFHLFVIPIQFKILYKVSMDMESRMLSQIRKYILSTECSLTCKFSAGCNWFSLSQDKGVGKVEHNASKLPKTGCSLTCKFSAECNCFITTILEAACFSTHKYSIKLHVLNAGCLSSTCDNKCRMPLVTR
jgi:hypothetical protein